MSEKASVKLSTKSWHYKLIKFILGSAAPTPYNMHNLCPYFWLLIFSLLATPFVAPIKGFAKLLRYLVDGLANIMESLLIVPIANTWEENLTDLDVYYLWNWEQDLNKYFIHAHKKEGGISREDLLKKWWNKNMGEDIFDPKSGETTEKFQKWVLEMREKENALEEDSRKKRYEESSKKEERKEKMEKFQRGMDNFLERVGDQFRSWKNLIKWTKRIMGLIITSMGLFVTFIVVNFLGRGVLFLIDNWNWEIFFVFLMSFVIVGLLIGFIYVMGLLGKYLEAKGRKLWVVNILYYLAMGLFLPFKWVFYNFLWQIVLVNIAYLIKKGAIGCWDGLLGFLGIFGEYFGASYTDYCPGIDWEEEK